MRARNPSRPAISALLAALALCLVAGGAQADQYRTYASKVPENPIKQPTKQHLEQQLKTLKGNPYGQTLILRHLANMARVKGDNAKARHYLQRAIDLNALAPAAMQQMRGNLAQLYASGGKQKQVVETMEPLLKKGVPAKHVDPDAWLALGNAYARLGQWDKAVKSLHNARLAGEKGETLNRLQAAVAMQAGHYDAAARAFKKLVEAHPDNKAYLLQLAAANSKRGAAQKSVAALEVAQRLGMLDTPELRLRLIRAYRLSGAPFYAASRLQAWMQQGRVPKTAANNYLLAATWIAARETARAIQPLRAAARATHNARYFAQLGQLYMDQAKWSRAAQAYHQALANGGVGAATGKLLISQGLAYYQLADGKQAQTVFRKARQYKGTAALAGQWLAFLDARPQGLPPSQIKGFASSSGGILSAANTATNAVTVPGNPTNGNGLPPGVPKTGDRYTPVGAVRAGNDQGVPAWTGGITPQRAPASFKPGGPLVNPYAGEQPLFTITNANLGRYKNLLAPGFIALFKHYKNFTLPVYPTHRSAAFPGRIYRAALANQGRAHLKNPDALVGAKMGFPFRQPTTGVQAMWNHRLRYRGKEINSRTDEAIVGADGIDHMQRRVTRVLFGYGNPDRPSGMGKNILAYYMMYPLQDGRRKRIVLAYETMDNTVNPRRIWVASTKYGRVVRLPPVGYDFPRPGTDDLMYVDQIDMYNGAYNHYVWRLLGRRTMVVPYNAYALQSRSLSYKKLLQPHFPARGPMRYERHRVWVVEATTRQGTSNTIAKRVFYIDEDSWSILLVDCYDRHGKLWRFQVGHPVERYDQQFVSLGPVFIYDFKSGRYLATRLTNHAPGVDYNAHFTVSQFRPSTLRNMLN